MELDVRDEKHIMTILGPRIMTTSDKILPYEHITSDMSNIYQTLIEKGTSKDSSDKGGVKIDLKTLSKVRKYPYCSLQNCIQSDTAYVLGHELIYAQEKGISFIVDATPKIFNKDWEKLKKVSEEICDKVSIITGCTGLTDSTLNSLNKKHTATLSSDEYNLLIEKIESYELQTGYHGLKAGFIGELIIIDMNDTEKARLTSAVAIKTGVPILVSIDDNLDALDKFIEFVTKDLQYDSEKLIVQFSEIVQLLNTNFTILITQYSRGLGLLSSCTSNYQIKNNYHEIAQFLSNLDDDALAKRILISSGVCFKSQMMQFGGDGYSSIYEYLTENNYISSINPDLIKTIFCENPRDIFSWWVKPPVEIIEVPMFKCRWCDDQFPDDGSHEKFEKFDNTYCSMKCLSMHRKFGFE